MIDPKDTQDQSLNTEGLVLCYEACKEFVRKVESGAARSLRSYAQMKAAIERAEKGDPK